MKKIFLLVLLFISFNVLYSQEKVLTNNGVYKTIDELLGNKALDPADFSGGKFIQESNGAFVPKTLAELRGYKVYTALLTQTDTNPPVATVLQNDIGQMTLGYITLGTYYIESSGLFLASKTVVLVLNPTQLTDGNSASVEYSINTINQIGITTYSDKYITPVNDELSNTPIEIRIYY